MTDEIVSKLEFAFSRGLNITEACLYAGISRPTYYEYIKDNQAFSDKIEDLQENVKMHAKMNVAEAIIALKGGQMSTWFLERRDKDFKPKQETDNKGQVTVNIVPRRGVHAGSVEEDL